MGLTILEVDTDSGDSRSFFLGTHWLYHRYPCNCNGGGTYLLGHTHAENLHIPSIINIQEQASRIYIIMQVHMPYAAPVCRTTRNDCIEISYFENDAMAKGLYLIKFSRPFASQMMGYNENESFTQWDVYTWAYQNLCPG